jgi:hypothetical protein
MTVNDNFNLDDSIGFPSIENTARLPSKEMSKMAKKNQTFIASQHSGNNMTLSEILDLP